MIRFAVLGSKGGSGKTLLSHVICHGLSNDGIEAYHFTTDEGRLVLSTEGRHYAILDGRDPAKLDRAIEMLAQRDCAVVIDGCANRPRADVALTANSDIVLVPFQASAEDMRVAQSDLERLPTALGVPMRWPANLWQRTFTDRLLARYLTGASHRIIDPIFSKSALATLLLDEPPDPRIAALCRDIASDILRRGGFTIADDSVP